MMEVKAFVKGSFDQCKGVRDGGIRVATMVKMLHVEVGLASVDPVLGQSCAKVFGCQSRTCFILDVFKWVRKKTKHDADDELWLTVLLALYFGHSR